MASHLIKLEDGTLVEVEKPEGTAAQVAGTDLEFIAEASFEKIKPILSKVAKPILETYKELNKEVEIIESEIELGLGFEVEGNVFVARSKGNANLVIRLKLSPKK